MILEFDDDTINLSVRVGPLENYTPTEEVKNISSKCEELKKNYLNKKEELRLLFAEYVEKVIAPEVAKITENVHKINQENNSHLLK